MKSRPITILLVGLLTVSATRPAAPSPTPPAPGLRELRSPAFQAALESALHSAGLGTAIRSRKLAVALVGLEREECPRLAAVNGNSMMYAASLPKIAIALAVLRKAQDGDLVLNENDRALLHAMIRKSSNRAASQLIERAGKDYINDLLRSEDYRLYDKNWGGGLWVGKPYGPAPAFRRDPLHQISHGATAVQVARFFYLLDTGQLLDEEMSRLMKEILRDPGIEHKFVAALRERNPKTRFLRKSGTWRTFHADAAMIEHDGLRYILVGLADSKNGEQWLRQLASAVDDLMERFPPPCAPPGPRRRSP